MMDSTKGAWRVQATWTVGDQERSYQPVFVPTREEADRMAAEMAETLAHFPTLTILLDFDPDGVPTNFDERPSQPRRSTGLEQ